MKTLLTIIITVLIAGIGGYLLGPMLIEREVQPFKAEIPQLQNRLQASEEFVKAEEEARKRTSLKADTGLPDVVKTVNRLAPPGNGTVIDLSTL
jgi:predicted PurR-regulated permease PerM